MKERYLEVTFRKGRPLAAYLYLPRSVGTKAVRTENIAPGIQVDFAADNSPIGLELTDPQRVRPDAINDILQRLGLPKLDEAELKPLLAA